VNDIQETQGITTRSSPTPTSVSKVYGMLPPTRRAIRAADAGRQPDHATFVIGPDKVKLILVYLMTTRRNFDEVLRVIDSLQLTARTRSRRR
jgi:alkyl hydroperoxide reductase subunit AhpC